MLETHDRSMVELQQRIDADLPEGYRVELVDGEVLVSPPPGDDHQAFGDVLAGHLRAALPKRYRALTTPGVWGPDGSWVIPDPEVVDRETGDVVLVVEINRGDLVAERRDWGAKRRHYAALGIPRYWIAGYRTPDITELVLDHGAYVEHAHARGSAPFRPSWPEGFEVRPADLAEY